MRKFVKACVALALCITPMAVATVQAASVKEPDTITIAWLPNNSGEQAKVLREEFGNVIAKATGKKVEHKLTTDYIIAIKALDSGDCQIGWFGPFEYLTSHANNPHVVPMVVESGDSGTLSDALYYSRFLVKKGNESHYKSANGYGIDHIVGKKISFVSHSSTSGFNMPAMTILGKFTKEAKWKNLTKEDLAQGGEGKFFSQVMFAGSHQLSLVNLLTGKSDVSAVDDIDVAQYVELTSGKENENGAVYAVRKDAEAPFDALAGAQYVIITPIPVQNTPVEINSEYLTQKSIDAIKTALISDTVTKNEKIFAPKSSKGAVFVQPHRFLTVEDSWYNPMRKTLGIK